MTTNIARQPSGVPVGGQFAASARAESDVSLTANLDTVPASSVGDVGSFTAEKSPIVAEPNYADIAAKYRNLRDLAYPADNPDGLLDERAFRSAFKPSAIVGNAHRIYDYMSEHNVGPDSATREAAFAYAVADTGRDYNDVYDAWINEKPLMGPCTTCGTVLEARLADVIGRCSDCVHAWVREMTKRR